MHFTCSRLLIIASTLLSISFALPVVRPHNQGLSVQFGDEFDKPSGLETAELFGRAGGRKKKKQSKNLVRTSGSDEPNKSLLPQSQAKKPESSANEWHTVTRKKPKSQTLSTSGSNKPAISPLPQSAGPSTSQFQHQSKHPPYKEKGRQIIFLPQFHQDLKDRRIQGKRKKVVMDFHRDIIDAHMNTFPEAHLAEVRRALHVGGNDPNEAIHTTVQYFKKPEDGQKMGSSVRKMLTIPNIIRGRKANELVSASLHHVYLTATDPPLPADYAEAEKERLRRSTPR